MREAIEIRNAKLMEGTRAALEAGDPPPEEEEVGRLGFDPSRKLLDLTQLCPTDMKNNKRVIMPPSRPMSEELAISARRAALLHTAEDYIKANCDLKG